MQTEKTAQVYRFRDKIAFHTENSQTLYLTPQVAKEMAKALLACVKDCNMVNFSGSHLSPFEISEK